MIINNTWYPGGTNLRTLLWARVDFTRPPLIELIVLLTLMGLVPSVCMLSVITGGVTWQAVAIAASSITAYLWLEWRFPLQKYVGVPLDGFRLTLLSRFVEGPFLVASYDRVARMFVDSYLQMTAQDAARIELHRRGILRSEVVYRGAATRAHDCAVQAAELVNSAISRNKVKAVDLRS